MAPDGNRPPASLEREIAEVEANLLVLVEAELEAQHELDPHAPRVAECPVCRRFGVGA